MRRSRFLLATWGRSGLRVRNYATGRSWTVTGVASEVLAGADAWIPTRELLRTVDAPDPATVERAILDLLRLTLLEGTGREADPRERALARWDGWNPAAGYFHTATRDVAFRGTEEPEPQLQVHLRPYPSPLKRYPEAPRVPLPPFPRSGAFPRALLERRTWRNFGEVPVRLDQLSTLLGLTWGVQRWLPQGAGRRTPLKTSPSGGARHGLEAYVLARRVEGLERATYHYAPDDHALSRIAELPSREERTRFLGRQPEFADADATVFMTAVFERVQWRYDSPRAYRVVLLEAGHFCQTFCLTATWLGLAPFCTAALADSAVERHLEIDGIGESVLYAAGVGSRPGGVEWAPVPWSLEAPATTPPMHESRPGR